MRKTFRLLSLFMMLCVCLIFPEQVAAQTSEITSMMPNSAPQAELFATTQPIFTVAGFEGLHNLPESEVRKAFREQRIGVGTNAIATPENIEKATRVIKELLADSGYFNPAVGARLEDVTNKSKSITFIVDEGEHFILRGIEFEGNKIFTDDELRAQIKLFAKSATAGRFDRNELTYDLNTVRSYMRSKGYLAAKTGEPRHVLSGNGINIIVPVVEERLYRIGKITVEGPTLISPEQAREVIDLKQGDVANDKQISDALFEKLKNVYWNAGYLQYSAEADSELRRRADNPDEGIVDLKITIDENTCFVIRAIEFIGNVRLTDEELRGFILLRAGDTFSRQQYLDSIKNLNETGLLEPIDAERDFDFATDEENALVDITIKVRERLD